MKKRNVGIITILVGVGLLFHSILFSSEDDLKPGFRGEILQREIVLVEGKFVADIEDPPNYGYYEGKVAIKLKYMLSLSAVLVLLGTGVVLLSNNKDTKA